MTLMESGEEFSKSWGKGGKKKNRCVLPSEEGRI